MQCILNIGLDRVQLATKLGARMYKNRQTRALLTSTIFRFIYSKSKSCNYARIFILLCKRSDIPKLHHLNMTHYTLLERVGNSLFYISSVLKCIFATTTSSSRHHVLKYSPKI